MAAVKAGGQAAHPQAGAARAPPGSKTDRGYDVRAVVERVKRYRLEDAALGLVIRVNMEGSDRI
jgi:hypothetical protein